jgi:hypothetical protein
MPTLFCSNTFTETGEGARSPFTRVTSSSPTKAYGTAEVQ